MRAVLELARPHAREQIQVLLHRSIAMGAVLARLGQRAAIAADLLRAEVVHVGQALLDQTHGAGVELLEVVGRVAQPVAPVKAQPVHVLADRVRVFDIFLDRVGVVETQVARAAVLFGHAEVEADRLGMADVQVAVGLRREARVDLTTVLARGEVALDPAADEILAAASLGLAVVFCHASGSVNSRLRR